MTRSAFDQQLTADNLRTWLELEALKLGTDNQRERHMAGVLPEEELAFLARSELFAAFPTVGPYCLKRWAGRDRQAIKVKHEHDCPMKLEHEDALEIETADVDELSADEWDAYKRIQKIAGTIAMHPWLQHDQSVITVVTSTHWATCKHCKAEASRSSVKVTVPWAGRLLTREYAI